MQHTTTDDTVAIDKITYLASLASTPQAIDPMLDDLREITAKHTTGTPFSPNETLRLEQLQTELINQLCQDKLRNFTKEGLADALRLRFGQFTHNPKRSRTILWTIWGLGIASYVASFALPGSLDMDARGEIAAALLLNIVSIGAGLLFLLSLGAFREQLKLGLQLLCIGTVIIGLSQIQLPLNSLLNWADSPLFKYGGFSAPYTVATFLMFFGLRRFAKQLQIKTLVISLPFAAGLAAVVALGVMVLPHASQPADELFFDIALITLATTAAFSVCSAVITYKLLRVMSPLYRKALVCLLLMLLLVCVGTLLFASLVFIRGELQGNLMAIASVPFLISALLMLQAGYYFHLSTKY